MQQRCKTIKTYVQQRFLEDVKSLNLRFPVSEIAKETGYSSGNVSEILNGKKEPSENFLKMFYKKFFDERNAFNEDEVKYPDPQTHIAYLNEKIAIKEKEIENLKTIIQEKERLIQSKDELIEMIKKINERVPKEEKNDSITNKNMQPT